MEGVDAVANAVVVRPLTAADDAWKVAALEHGWGSTVVGRLGELVDAAGLPGFVALDGDTPVGLLTLAPRRNGVEIVTIQAMVEGRGIGRALLDAAREDAVAAGASRLWLVTTNDNERAIHLYCRWGMVLHRVIPDGVAASRRLKPTIPLVDASGEPIRDELEFELVLIP